MVETLDIRRAGLFESLSPDEVALAEGTVEYRRCPPETVVVETGSPDRSLFVIYSGCVRIVKREPGEAEIPIAEVLPGQHFGEVTFVDGGVRTATAITNETSELLVIHPDGFQALARRSPAIGFKIAWALLRLQCGRLRNTDFWLFELMDSRGKAPAEAAESVPSA